MLLFTPLPKSGNAVKTSLRAVKLGIFVENTHENTSRDITV